MPAAAPFDRIAATYDDLWTGSAVGSAQRAAVWRVIDGLFALGERVLDLGCGTGADAMHLSSRGIHVTALDSSESMVRIALAKGVDARRLAIEDLAALSGLNDGAISNFGVFNCVHDLAPAARELARLIRPGGVLAICLMGRFCLWECAYYLYRRQPRKAFRRLRGRTSSASLGVDVYYPSARRVERALRPAFSLVDSTGIGLCVPPSYVTSLSRSRIEQLSRIDERLARLPLLRALSDHRLLVFVRS